MFRILALSGAVRCALALFALAATQGAARAAFAISVNGSVVATDGGGGDTNASAGVLTYSGTVAGYQLNISASTQPSGSIASTIQIVEIQGIGKLSITISGSFQGTTQLGTGALSSSLSRDLVEGHDTSGLAALTTHATSESGGGEGSTEAITLSSSQSGGEAEGTFDRTSSSYWIDQTIVINGLGDDKALLLTAKSEYSSLEEGDLDLAPAPSGAVLLLSGAGFLGCVTGLRRLRSGRPVVAPSGA